MLSKLARTQALRAKTLQSKQIFNGVAKRFNSEIATSQAGGPTLAENIKFESERHLANNKKLFSAKDVSDYAVAGDAAELAEKKEYHDMLADVDARQKFFGALTAHNSDDHKAVKDVKTKIATLLQQEMEEMGLKHQLSEEEKIALETDTYAEVATKSNFYFSLDENKKSKNLKIYDFEAPGNKFRHPNVILPHEHCDIQNYLDTRDLTEDKLTEIYAYYSLLIDMHIA